MKTIKIPVADVRLGMKQGPGGDWFEHDLADMAVWAERDHPGCRVCFDYELSRVINEDGTRHPVVVVEGLAGYRPTTFDIGSTDETALWNVERANAALALTKDDVKEIIASTM